MSNRNKATLVPKLRFPEFQGAEGWQQRPLGSVATFFKGKGLPKSALTPDGKTSCIHYGELFTEYQEVIGAVRSRTNLEENVFLSVKNDVLMPTSDVTPSGLAKACCLNSDDIILGGDILVIRTERQAVNGEFLARHIRHLENKVLQLVSGSTVFHLYASSMEKLVLSFPGKHEQQKIVDCLSSLDDLIAVQAHKVDALKTHKKGLMQQLFPREGETQPRLRFSGFHSAGEWEVRKLEELAKRGSGHTPSKSSSEYYDGGIKWVSLADSKYLDAGLISTTKIEISKQGIKNSSAVLHPAGTVLISRDAGVGKSAVMEIPMAVSQHFIVWTCNPLLFSNWFLYHLLQKMKPVFERIAVGSTIKTIGLPFFKELCVSVPSLPEQQCIADCLNSLDDLITATTQELEALKTHKNGLMQQLFPSAEAVEA